MDDDLTTKFSMGKNSYIDIQDPKDQIWMMKITKGKIIFNREQFPDLCEDEFSYKILKCLESANVIQIDEKDWNAVRIKME